ncbi:hypothetical protein V8E54_009634 [Elaphomyces granulatus]
MESITGHGVDIDQESDRYELTRDFPRLVHHDKGVDIDQESDRYELTRDFPRLVHHDKGVDIDQESDRYELTRDFPLPLEPLIDHALSMMALEGVGFTMPPSDLAEIGVQCHTAKTYSTFRSRVVIMKLETFAAELVDAGCSLPPHKINTPKDPEPRCYNSCVRRLYVYGGSKYAICPMDEIKQNNTQKIRAWLRGYARVNITGPRTQYNILVKVVGIQSSLLPGLIMRENGYVGRDSRGNEIAFLYNYKASFTAINHHVSAADNVYSSRFTFHLKDICL